MRRFGLIINPIAGMGGKVGLKGTDNVADKAIDMGALPVAPERAGRMLAKYNQIAGSQHTEITWVTCKGDMGEYALKSNNISCEIIYEPDNEKTARFDTINAAKLMAENNVDLIVFCGGDGTARDISSVLSEIPILGVPSGVKMHSGVFAVSPEAAAEIICEFFDGALDLASVEIMDLDEDKYRLGEWSIKLFGMAKTPFEPSFTQASKMMILGESEEAVQEAIAESVSEEMEENPGTLYLLGPGSTVEHLGKELGLETTLLGIDAISEGKIVGLDINDDVISGLLEKYDEVKLVLSPIGAQGFILGRGNLQLTSATIKRVGLDNIIVLATPAKLDRTPVLRVDTGDPVLDLEFAEKKYLRVHVGYQTIKLVSIAV